MKSILHLKDDTEYQIPLRETEKDDKGTDRAKVVVTSATQAGVKKETEAEKAANKEKVNDGKKATATQSQDDPTAKKTNEISREEVTNEDDPALNNLEEENPNQEHPNTGESNSGTTTESAPQVDSAKAALDEMKKLASQEGVVHPSLFISNFSKILGLMERAMQLQVKESGSVTKEEAPKATEPATEQTETLEKTEVPEQTETPAEDK